MMNKMIVKMIRIKNHPISEAYANYCAPSWKGFDFEFYDAVTPDTLSSQRGLKFSDKKSGPHTETEKACLYSQYNLWKECARSNKPYLILEHDAYLEKPEAIQYNPYLFIQFFGQHAMEAVLFNPSFARELILKLQTQSIAEGPMAFVDRNLGYFNKGTQSLHGRPHARWMGKDAPVKSVLDPELGNTVAHVEPILDRIKDPVQRDLFKITQLGDK